MEKGIKDNYFHDDYTHSIQISISVMQKKKKMQKKI